MRVPPRALARIIPTPIVPPCGLAQSSGTLSVAHCQSLPGAGESAVALQVPQASFCPVSEEGSAAVVPEEPDEDEADGADAPVFSPPLPSSDDEPLLHPPTSSAAAAPRAVHRTSRAM